MLPRHTILNFGAWPVEWQNFARRVSAPLGIIIAWVVFFTPYLVGRRVAPGDSIDQYYPTSVFVARALAEGDSPFWNPHLFAGYPAIGDPQSALWFPGFLLYNWLVGPADIRWFNVMVLLHLLMGGLSTYALLRDLGCSRFAGLVGALVFMFGGSASGRLQHSFPISALSWFPLTFLMLRRGLVGLDWRWTLGAGVALGFLLPTALQHVALLSYALALYGWIVVLRDHRGWALVKGVALLALILASALAVALPGLAFTYQLALESIRPAVEYTITFYHAIHPKMLLTAFFPNLYGHLGGPWIGLGDKSETYVYFGIMPLVLLALALVKPRPVRFEAVFMAGLALVCVLYALGDWTPLHGLMWHHLPMLNVYRRQSEGLILLVLPMAVLSGLAWNRLETVDWTPRRRRMALALLALLAALGPGLVGAERLRMISFGLGPHAGATWMILLCLIQMAAAVGALWLVRAWRHPAVRPFAWTAVAILLVAELALFNRANELNSVKRAELDRMNEFNPVLALARQAGTLTDGQLWRVKPAYLEHALERLPPGVQPPHWPSTGQWWNWPPIWGFQSTGGYNPVRVAAYEWLAD
jgi:hypothetical protein